MAGAAAGPPWPNGSYRTFRPQADLAGLEALDSGCDLEGGQDFEQFTAKEGNATFALQAAIGFRTKRPVDRVRITLTQLMPTTQSTQPVAIPASILFMVRLSHSGCGDVWFNKLLKPTDYNAKGLITQLAGLLFDTCEMYVGLPVADPNNGAGVKMVLRVIVDRCGCCSDSVPHETDGPIVFAQ